MPPRRRGRGRGQFQESEGQNEDWRSIPLRGRGRRVEDEVDDLTTRVESMEIVMARFQRMSPQIFNGDESSEDVDSWLRYLTGLFDRVQYDDMLRLSLATFQLRKSAECWWRGASRTLEETFVNDPTINIFRQTYGSEVLPIGPDALDRMTTDISYNMKYYRYWETKVIVNRYISRGTMNKAVNRYLSGNNSKAVNRYLSGKNNKAVNRYISRGTTEEAVDSAIDIEEGLWNRRSCARPQGAQGVRPAVQGAQSSRSSQSVHQPPQQQLAQQSETKQTSSKVTVEQSAIGIYESVTSNWNQSQANQSQATVNQSEDTIPDARYRNQSQATVNQSHATVNQSQDTRNKLTLKPVAVNSALLDSNKEGYLLVSNGEGYLLVSRKEGYLLVSHKEGYLLVSHKEGYLLVSQEPKYDYNLVL
ncbi:hypothetical protein F511_15485 [Dorcoceras hygrometricum]|uniref:Retrotransposon gag domain-containing protein n=1 Tax=Dorcoceras hygrometricum TaxID=472368 RepID=A0A2Z7CVI1_9LAMI|nr:hypothetical protein F511_15485 [Dorcoceras hygrometricum]